VNRGATSWPLPLDLLPHGPRACCVDRILDFAPGQRVAAHWTVREDSPLYDPERNGVPAWAGVEIMAQCAGLYLGLSRGPGLAGPAPSAGYLVGARRIDIAEPLLPLHAGLLIHAECEAAALTDRELGSFECRILCADKLHVSARLMLWCGETDREET
jgi:predicted hotdog family 3-hydroxylacyl-ACP dehydratase